MARKGLNRHLPQRLVNTEQTWFRGIYPGDILAFHQTLVDMFEKEGAQGAADLRGGGEAG